MFTINFLQWLLQSNMQSCQQTEVEGTNLVTLIRKMERADF